MVRDYLSRLSSHEPACLLTTSHILSKPVGPFLTVDNWQMAVDNIKWETNIRVNKFFGNKKTRPCGLASKILLKRVA